VDVATRRIVRNIPVGLAPFALALSKKHRSLFVSNRGGRRPANNDFRGPSGGSYVVTDPTTGATTSGTLSVIDLETLAVRDIAIGLAPSGLALSPDEALLVVANGHSDSVSLVDTSTLAVSELKIPSWPDAATGSQPIGAAFSPDGKLLYVACAGTNSIAVFSAEAAKKWTLVGAVPTGWFPSAIAIDQNGGLCIVTIKGVGNTAYKPGIFSSTQYEGSLVRIPAPTGAQLAAGTREVIAANTPKFEPAGGVSTLRSLGIQYVFLIIKENRTYDQVLGDLVKGNGDPKLVHYGREITPNTHALAEQYVLLDNFYAGGAVSFDGHHWLMQGFVSDYVERALSGPRGYAYNMTDAMTISPTGFFWQHATQSVSVLIRGEFSLPARWDPTGKKTLSIEPEDLLTWDQYWRLYREGTWRNAVGSRSGVPALEKLVDPRYPNDCLVMPDQMRADVFLDELAEAERTGIMPNLNVFTLPMNHTMGTRPGSPTPRAMVADNDLALGRMVEGISKSRFWPKSLILVVEDDASDGLDHVDGHRTVALAIGPHIRRGVVDSNHYNQASMIRTIQEIFHIPPRTRFLRSARAMTSVFTAAKDLTPYQCVASKVPIDEMNPPLKALAGRRLWAARSSLAMNWSHVDEAPPSILNRILWWDRMGYDVPYPRLERYRRMPQRGSRAPK
ncbi:MAG: bifunctional YncE family protein/alkaline phosphatase family protein, partial [Candidatus Solibacter sp.]